MKTLFLTAIISMSIIAGALAQGNGNEGDINFSNFPLPGYVTFGDSSPSLTSPTNAAPVGSYEVELLFGGLGFNTSLPQSAFAVLDTFIPAPGSGNGLGYFSAGDVTGFTSVDQNGVFEVEGFGLGQYADYQGLTPEFVNFVGKIIQFPTPTNLSGWNGSLVLTEVPEPSVMALGGAGAAALLFYRRKK